MIVGLDIQLEVGGFGDCEDCKYRDHRGYGYDCFSKKTHYLECKCVSYANPKGCQKSLHSMPKYLSNQILE